MPVSTPGLPHFPWFSMIFHDFPGSDHPVYKQRIPESSCARKETINKEIKWTSLENNETEPVESVQMNIYQSNTYRKDLSWLHFNNESRVQERQQVKDQQSCMSTFVAYLTIPSTNLGHNPRHDNSIHIQRYRATSGERNFIERIKVPSFMEAILAIEIM